MLTIPPPGLRLLRLMPTAPAPLRADRAAGGTLPTRAARWCDAVTTASAYGFWLFAPMDMSLLWDGGRVFWCWAGQDDWLELDAAQAPGQAARFDAAAPPELAGLSPPMLTALPEPGLVQVWTGYHARTAPGWSLHVRPPANLPRASGWEAYEGIVETDRRLVPVFTNIRLTRTDQPVHLRTDRPIVQAQPLPRAAYAEAAMESMQLVPGPDALTPADWAEYAASLPDPQAPPGRDAAAARRRRAGCPFAGAA